LNDDVRGILFDFSDFGRNRALPAAIIIIAIAIFWRWYRDRRQ